MLSRRTPLKRKRDKPRRNEGRVTHGRMKPKATGKTNEEARHIECVASLGCLICGKPAEVHHVMHAPGKATRRDHRFVAPLCPDHHRGNEGVHGLGSEKAFLALWGVDLVEWCIDAWLNREAPEGAFWRDSVTQCREIAFRHYNRIKGGQGARKDEQTRINLP